MGFAVPPSGNLKKAPTERLILFVPALTEIRIPGANRPLYMAVSSAQTLNGDPWPSAQTSASHVVVFHTHSWLAIKLSRLVCAREFVVLCLIRSLLATVVSTGRKPPAYVSNDLGVKRNS